MQIAEEDEDEDIQAKKSKIRRVVVEDDSEDSIDGMEEKEVKAVEVKEKSTTNQTAATQELALVTISTSPTTSSSE